MCDLIPETFKPALCIVKSGEKQYPYNKIKNTSYYMSVERLAITPGPLCFTRANGNIIILK